MDGIVRTWATQLIRQNKTSLDLASQVQQTRKTRRASRDDVWMILKELTTQIHRSVLVLDGLDEFRSDDDRRSQFLGDLKHALQGTNARVIITSRTEFDIESGLRVSATEPQKYSLLDCNISRQHVKDDIDLVSKSMVARKLPRQQQHLREELAAQMAERCDGQFLWLKFQQDLLRDSKSPKALRAVVQAMPQKLHAVYERSWSFIVALEEPDRSRAIDTLRWLTFAYTPLSVQELAEALVVSLDQTQPAFSEEDLPRNIDAEYIDGEIKNLCGSLIELREDTKDLGPQSTTVRLVHASVHDFLVSKLPLPSFVGSNPGYSYLSTAQHAQLAAQCIRFLDCAETWVSTSQTPLSFTKYAAVSWFRHFQDSGKDFGPITTLVNNFMRRGNPNFARWRVLYEERRISNTRKPGTSFYYACLFGLVPAMDFLRNSEGLLDLNVRGGEYCTPLQAVCSTGDNEAFDRLIHWKADVTVRGGRFGNAFNAAAYHNRIDMMKSLVARESAPHTLRTEMHGAMTTAAGQGHIEIVEFLLHQGANIGLLQSYSLYMQSRSQMVLWRLASPLHAATASRHLNVVTLLVEHGADVDLQDLDETTALHIAVKKNSLEIVELLLHYNANPNLTGYDGGALRLAARHGHLNIAMQLIERKAILDLQDPLGRTPLHEAAENGHVKVVQYLCTRGADINTQSNGGWTPLYCAAANGHTEIAAYLVDEGADVNRPTNNGRAALHTAIINGHSEVARMLLRAGATLTSTHEGLTPLHFAAIHGTSEIIMPLIQAGADRNAQSHDGSTPLHDAAHGKHLAAVDLLLESGAVIKVNDLGQTPLHHAAYVGSFEVMTRLLEGRADLHARDCLGWTHLHMAAEKNFSDIVAFLLDQGSNLDTQCDGGFTALHIAVFHNSCDVVDLLISQGADVNIVDQWGSGALHKAVETDKMKLVRSLVEGGCDVNATMTNGKTPLHIAVERGNEEIIKYLIQSGADLDSTDCFGMTYSNWLRRSRPNLNISLSTSELVRDHSSSPNMTVLRRTIVRLATQLKEAESDPQQNDLYIIAHCFILLDMEDDARSAYQQYLLLTDIARGSRRINCDGCSTPQNRNNRIFACKICPNTDLCNRNIMKTENWSIGAGIMSLFQFLSMTLSSDRVTLGL